MKNNQFKSAAQVIFNELDLNLSPESFKQEGTWYVSERLPISTSKIGVMALMIKTLSVKISVGWDEQGITYLNYDFSYTHPNGGSNGHEVRRQMELR
jgi:hypothetical protein